VSQNYVIGPGGPGGTTNAGHGAALYLPNRRHPAVMIANTGATTIFVNDKDPLRDPSAGQPLTAGSSLGWDADRSLYMTCPTSGTVTITENGGTLMDAGAIASQIINQGLAQDIADAIYITGTPPVDKYTQLDSSGNIPPASGYDTPWLDVSGYQSIVINFNNSFSGGAALNPGTLIVEWNADAFGAVTLAFDQATAGSSIIAGDYTTWILPVKGPFVQVRVISASGGAGASMRIYGSYKAVSKSSFTAPNDGSVSGTVEGSEVAGFATWAFTVPVSTTVTWQPPTVAGHAKLLIRGFNATPGTMTMLFRTLGTVAAFTSMAAETGLVPTAATVLQYDLILPPGPLLMSMQNASAANTLQFRASLFYENPY
jgi:hypothetical protein